MSPAKPKNIIFSRVCVVCKRKVMHKESAFSFPIHDPDRCEQWIKNIGQPVPNPKSCFVCELHFEAKYLSKNATLRKRLVMNAVPTLNLRQTNAEIAVNSSSTPTEKMKKKLAELSLKFERKESILRAVIQQKDLHIQQLKQTIDELKSDDNKYNLHEKRSKLPFKKRFSNM